jgi:hypothetical protein
MVDVLGIPWAWVWASLDTTRSNLRVSVGCIIPYLIMLTYANGHCIFISHLVNRSETGPALILPGHNHVTDNDGERNASLVGIRIPPPKIIDDSPSYPTPRGNQ